MNATIQVYRQQLQCNFEALDDIFSDCMDEACRLLTEQGIEDYLHGASKVCMVGRGYEPVQIYLQTLPQLAAQSGEALLTVISDTVWAMSRSPNGKAILPFLQSLSEITRHLGSLDQIQHYLALMLDFMQATSRSIHGDEATIASPGLIDFLNQSPYLLKQISLQGLKNWLDYGVRNYHHHPERQCDYCSLQSADSRAVLQRERHGTLFVDHTRKLELYLRALWQEETYLVPYSLAFDELRQLVPYYDSLGMRLPDVYQDRAGVSGIDRYRVMLAHMAGHRRWSSAIVADNFSPFQRIAVELFEDARIDTLILKRFPGLRHLFLALHPQPEENACDEQVESCIRHRLAILSRALLDANHPYTDPHIIEFVRHFHTALQTTDSSTAEMAQLAVAFIAKTRRSSDQSSQVRFDDTEVDYRDDNRHLWIFIEQGDEEESFEQPPDTTETTEIDRLPPRYYPEWDYNTHSYRPDWVSVYETLQGQGNAAEIDHLLSKHAALAKRLKRLLDLLKPQYYVRTRYQEEGSELDLDVAIRSLIDYRSGTLPDPRINMSHRHDGRNIAVTLLLDLSASLNEVPAGCEQTILQLSQEAVSLLAWAIEQLGDPFAIAGFHSNTRHDVRFYHFKGFSEHWGDEVKARLANMEAAYSTRMGAALRHAGHTLHNQQADKKLMLILTDGEPSDIDVKDQQLLIADAHKAVQELDQKGIYTYCISLDTQADEYVRDIFGHQYTVIDHVERLPEQLPQLFVALTR